MMKAILLAAVLSFCYSSGAAQAQSILVLKNGRQITVQSYRDDGSTIKFTGLGGEIGISKDQIQSITKRDAAPSGLDILRPELSSSSPTQESAKTRTPDRPAQASSTEKLLDGEKVNEGKEYQKRFKDLEDSIKTSRDQYSEITGGAATPEKSNLTESLQGWTKDLTSKLKDAQNAPISSYSQKELELKTLREKITNLEGEKNKLIQQMKEKDFEITPSPNGKKQ